MDNKATMTIQDAIARHASNALAPVAVLAIRDAAVAGAKAFTVAVKVTVETGEDTATVSAEAKSSVKREQKEETEAETLFVGESLFDAQKEGVR